MSGRMSLKPKQVQLHMGWRFSLIKLGLHYQGNCGLIFSMWCPFGHFVAIGFGGMFDVTSVVVFVDVLFLPAGAKSGMLPFCAPLDGVNGKTRYCFVQGGFSVNLKNELTHILRETARSKTFSLSFIFLLKNTASIHQINVFSEGLEATGSMICEPKTTAFLPLVFKQESIQIRHAAAPSWWKTSTASVSEHLTV